MNASSPTDPFASPSTKGLIGVMGGVVLYLVVSELLETVLVGAKSPVRPTDDAAYYAIRNTPGILGPKVAYNSLSAVWAGIVTARLAGSNEMAFGKLAAAVLSAYLVWQFLGTAHAVFTPGWMQAFMVLTTGPFLLLGASFRAKARAIGGATSEPGAQ